MDLEWTEEMSVGVDALDDDHKTLFKLLNHVLHTHQFLKAADTLQEALEALASYANQHFAREEDFMAEIDFPGLDAHKQQHAFFIEKIATFRAQIEDIDPIMVRISLILFLMDWLTKHILTQDSQYKRP